MSLNTRTYRYSVADVAPFIPLPMEELESADADAPVTQDDREAADPSDLPQQRRPG